MLAQALTFFYGRVRPDMAEAGAKLPEKLDEAIEAGAAFYREALG